MTPTYIIGGTLFSPLGSNLASNWAQILNNQIGIQSIEDRQILPYTFQAAAFKDEQRAIIDAWQAQTKCTVFEAICHEVIQQTSNTYALDLQSNDLIVIISTTKGNIDQLPKDQHNISSAIQHLQSYWNFAHPIQTISNACISGSLALVIGQRFISTGTYKKALVIGAETLDHFVVNGFNAFQALSKNICKPFDKNRDGINLGEAAASILLSAILNENTNQKPIGIILGGGVSNDANHLSGPSKTGVELAQAITDALEQSNISAKDIQAISAHGTGTRYNDEMESKAIAHADVNHAPIFSLKGFYGHTLGASGVLECLISLMAMNNNIILPNLHFEESDVSVPININTSLQRLDYQYLLKTASGFGGCNAAVVIQKL